MATSAVDLLTQHPTNSIAYIPNKGAQTNKSWALNYHPISNLIIHTTVSPGGVVEATYEPAFLPLKDDDSLRLSESALPPNKREWHIFNAADRELWFHTEISNIVLAAWSRYPAVVQTSHPKPQGFNSPADEVPIAYSMQRGSIRAILAVGEIKRNVIDREVWKSGHLDAEGTQERLSRELRGYVGDKPSIQCRHFLESSGVYSEN